MTIFADVGWLAELVDEASDAVFFLAGPKSHVVRANRRAHEFTGLAHLEGVPITTLFRADDPAWSLFLEALQGASGEPFRGTLHLRQSKDTWLPVQVTLQAAFSADQHVLLVRDLRPDYGSQTQIQNIFKNTPVALGFFDKELRFVHVNDLLAAINGMPAEEHKGRHVSEVLPPSMAAHVERALRQVVATGEAQTNRECLIVAASGEIHNWLVSYFPHFLPDGTLGGVYATLLDITERKRAEDQVRLSEFKYRNLVETSNDLIWSVDLQTRLTFVNRQALLKSFGYEPEEVIGRPFADFVAPEHAGAALATFHRVMAGEPCFHEETVCLHRSGDRVPVVFNAIVTLDEAGQPNGAMGTMTDVSQARQDQQALRESQQRFQDFMNNSPTVAFLKDAEGRYYYVNRAYERVFHLKPDDVLGKTDFDLWPLEAARKFRESDLAVLANNRPMEFTEYAPLPDGTLREWLVLKFPFVASSRLFVGGMALDVTTSKEAERALRASEERYRLLFERNLAGVFCSTVDGVLLDCNDSFVRILGYESREEILQHHICEFYIDSGERDRLLSQLRQHPLLTNYELRLRRRDGMPLWVLENVSLLTDQDGTEILEGTIIDINERKRTEEALRASEARYRTLIESLEQSIFLKDRDLRFRAANQNYCTILGCSESALLGKTDFDFFPREIAEKYRADDVLVLREGRHVQTEERQIHNRQTRIYRAVKTPVKDENDEIVGVLGILWDVTEQLSLETQLRHVQKMDAIGQLAGGVAHDFNNLLTVILGNLSYVLSRQLVTDEPLELLRNAEQAGMRAAELTQRLLGFSRRATLRAEPTSLNLAVQEAVRFLKPTIDPRIVLETNYASDLWLVRADAGLFNQLLMNLAINARDAMPKGGKLLFQTSNFIPDPEYLRLHLEARPGEFVRLRVQDTGHGMTSDVRQRIFEPFFTTKDIGKGTGLGLATVFTIVRQHNGWIVCESQVGVGSNFEVFLPRHVIPAAPPVEKVTPAPVDTGTETLLLVDDEAMVRNLGSLVLRKLGYKVLLAEDGRHALDIYQDKSKTIDLIILDGTMPRLSGRDTLRELVRLNPDVRVLFSSGYTVEHLDLADFPQVVGFMHKPYRVEDLAAKVRQILDMK